MKDVRNKELVSGISLPAAFAVWTILIRFVDVQNVGPAGTAVGFAAFNVWFHRITGVHMVIYTITDWLGLVPIIVCMCFGVLGLVELIKGRSLLKVDHDILLLGVYYVVVILGYLLFETVPINYRPTLKYQTDRRIANPVTRKAIRVFIFAFSLFMVIGRTISGVHWATDVVGSVFLSTGLYLIYRFIAEYSSQKKTHRRSEASNGVQ